MGPVPKKSFYYDTSNNILDPKSATSVNRVVICSVRQGVKKWTFSKLFRILVSQNRDTLHSDRVSVHFSDEDVDGHDVCNKNP